jgi:hypothetical protein
MARHTLNAINFNNLSVIAVFDCNKKVTGMECKSIKSNFIIIYASQAKLVHQYTNTKRKLLDVNAATCFTKLRKYRQLTTMYTVKIITFWEGSKTD